MVSSSIFFFYPFIFFLSPSILCFCSAQLPYLLNCSSFSHSFYPLLHPSEKSHPSFLYVTFWVLNYELFSSQHLSLHLSSEAAFLANFYLALKGCWAGRRRTPIPCSTAPSSLRRGASSFLSWTEQRTFTIITQPCILPSCHTPYTSSPTKSSCSITATSQDGFNGNSGRQDLKAGPL